VRIDSNLIRGNLAGAGDGGGIRIENVNGVDIANNLDNSNPWYDVYVTNNMITNNVAGLAGGGISLANAVSVFINYNTVANNDSVSTTALAGTPGVPNITNAHPAGIVSYAHSAEFGLLMDDAHQVNPVPPNWLTFSDPGLQGDIVYENRSFYWVNEPGYTGLEPRDCTPLDQTTCDFWDLEVLGTAGSLNPVDSLLTGGGDPAFVNPYFNGPRDPSLPGSTIQSAGAFDEGGNFIQVTYGPLTLGSFDYHIGDASFAIDAGGTPSGGGPLGPLQRLDYDDESRPQGVAADSGADEHQ
jgi:hypothetical protein